MSTQAERTSRATGPLLTLLGLLAIGLGVLAVGSPLISYQALLTGIVGGSLMAGVLIFITARSRWQQGAGLLWLAVGVAAAAWPGHPFAMLAILVGIGLLGSGIVALVDAMRRQPRATGPILMAAVLVIAAIGVMVWSQVSIIAATTVLGIFLITRGVRFLLGHDPAGAARGGRWHWGRMAGAGLLAVLALTLVAGGAWFWASHPVPDDFYATPDVLTDPPGTLLAWEPYTRNIPANAQAWTILYTTTRDDDTPAVASGLVVVPTAPTTEPVPLITWAHGTTGIAEGCAPSVLADGLETGAFFILDQVIDEGWALVATDYVGLGTEGPHPYLIGDQQARSVLDATRAARQLEGIDLSDETVVWGHSQGGHAALWTGQLAETYAPDVGVIGVAALAPAANLPGLVDSLEDITGGSLFGSYVLQAYSEIYPDVDFNTAVLPRNQVLTREMADRCLAERSILLSIGASLIQGQNVWDGDPMAGPLGPHLLNNVPQDEIAVPLFIGQGLADQLVLPSAQEAYVAQRCEMGTNLEYRTYEGRDHVPLVETDSPLIPDLVQWTTDRLNGTVATSTCAE